MIILDVKDYCHECPEFEVKESSWRGDTTICCKHRIRCKEMEKYLREKTEKGVVE